MLECPERNNHFLYSEIADVCDKARDLFANVCYGKVDSETKRKIRYYNFPCSFDIETSNFLAENPDENNAKTLKTAIMYVWQFSIDGLVLLGRTWEQFMDMIAYLRKRLMLNENNRLVVYVHNLGFDFSFYHKYFTVIRAFAVKPKTPIIVETKEGIEFRCSYLLSGYSLENVAKNLTEHDINKLTGNVDYKLIRHSRTPLTDKEIAYCVNDVNVIIAYIEERMKEEKRGTITELPMTATGYVRRYCREQCLGDGKRKKSEKTPRNKYRELIKSLTLEVEEYDMLKDAFQGGYTHANARYYDSVVHDVASYDFTSSYPAVMVYERFPMSKGKKVTITSNAQFKDYLEHYCCLFMIQFEHLRQTEYYESYISSYRTNFKKPPFTLNNGRLESAAKVSLTITEQDFEIINKLYTWDGKDTPTGGYKIGAFWYYVRGYLPTELVKAILHLYKLKTTLKGVKGMEAEYLHAKEMLNAIYGMCVTDIVRPILDYDTEKKEWKEPTEADKESAIEKENKRKRRFLFYAWGVWVTAYARKNLWTAIFAIKEDYIYSDTDSVKIKNAEKHKEYFDKFNALVELKLRRAMKHHGLDFSECVPTTKEGKSKMLGVWDYEHTFTKFKTLGAKRYLGVYYDEKYQEIVYLLTVSGVNKKLATPYLFYHKGDGYKDIWDRFTAASKANNYEGLYLPAGKGGKPNHFYIDSPRDGMITDYLGNEYHYHEESGTHLAESEYKISVTDDYIDFINYVIYKL